MRIEDQWPQGERERLTAVDVDSHAFDCGCDACRVRRGTIVLLREDGCCCERCVGVRT